MCEALFHTGTPLSGDPDVDAGRYRPGDVVVVMEDGHQWGRGESKAVWVGEGRDVTDWPRTFVLVKIPGLSVDALSDLLEPEHELYDTGVKHPELPGNIFNMKLLKRRLRFVDADSLPSDIKALIGSDNEITVTTPQIKNFFKNKSDKSIHDMGL